MNMLELHEVLTAASETIRPKQLINVIVEFLAEDVYWLNENISQVDKETLRKIIGGMK